MPWDPRCWETLLASIVVGYLVENIEKDSAGVTYLYCNYKARHEQTLIALLESLPKQLVSRRNTISENTEIIYEHHSRRKTGPSLGEVEKCFPTK